MVSHRDKFQILGFKAANLDVADCEVFDKLLEVVPAGSTALADGAYGGYHAYEVATNKEICLIARPKSSDVISMAVTQGDIVTCTSVKHGVKGSMSRQIKSSIIGVAWLKVEYVLNLVSI